MDATVATSLEIGINVFDAMTLTFAIPATQDEGSL